MPNSRSVELLRGLAVAAALAVAEPVMAHSPTGQVAGRAEALVGSLDAGQREKAVLPFDGEARKDWHYTPRRRPGLRLDEMSDDQRRRAWALMAAALSEVGFDKARGVILLEKILGEDSGNTAWRDPGNYAFAFFVQEGGRIGGAKPWGWRFEGHHLSLSFTVAPHLDLSFTPAFFGANPAVVREDHPEHGGMRLLADEHRLAFELLESLDDGQRGRAIIAGRTAGDIHSGPGRGLPFDAPEGLPASAMTEAQRDLLMRLVETYVGNVGREFAFRQMKRIEAAGVEKLHFAWTGATRPDAPHYYRIHGPVTLIEYDASQGGGDHVHSIWRDPTDPFGEDLQRRHLTEQHDHSHPHPH
ncbi:MAG: DUF3500 domain-containing protein [Acetobacterales bacterium]